MGMGYQIQKNQSAMISINKFYRITSELYVSEGLIKGAVVKVFRKESDYAFCVQPGAAGNRACAWVLFTDLETIN